MYTDKIKRAGGIEDYLQKKEKRSAGALIRRMRNNIKLGSRILEVGAGTGAIGALLIKYGYDVTAIDKDPNMVKILEKTFRLFNRVDNTHLIDAKDIISKFGSNSFDCVISHGMLEHYLDNEIINFLKMQLFVAPLVIFVVPIDSMSREYRAKGFGDERYLSTQYWKELIEKDFFIQHIFGFGFKEINFPCFFEIILRNNVISRLLAPLCGINEFWITSKNDDTIYRGDEKIF